MRAVIRAGHGVAMDGADVRRFGPQCATETSAGTHLFAAVACAEVHSRVSAQAGPANAASWPVGERKTRTPHPGGVAKTIYSNSEIRSWDNGVQKLGDGEFLPKPLLCTNSDAPLCRKSTLQNLIFAETRHISAKIPVRMTFRETACTAPATDEEFGRPVLVLRFSHDKIP
jgi:hypothetical protein